MSNLDDLFSKRDKKKKTTKAKFSTLDANEFAKQLEATTIANEDDDNRYDGYDRGTSGFNPNDNQDEEWKPFDSEDNKDYTGLKIIQNWKADDRDGLNDGSNEDGDRKNKFVWGSTTKNDDNTEAKEDEDADAKKEGNEKTQDKETVETSADNSKENEENKNPAVDSSASSTTGAYVPPALRRQQQQSANATAAGTEKSTAEPTKYVPPHLRGKQGDSSSSSAIPPTSVNYRRPAKSQPNIMDTMEFPTLDTAESSATQSSERTVNGNDKFEAPKKGGRVEPKAADKINLDNKFNALSTNN